MGDPATVRLVAAQLDRVAAEVAMIEGVIEQQTVMAG
jgi:hypothetical protein